MKDSTKRKVLLYATQLEGDDIDSLTAKWISEGDLSEDEWSHLESATPDDIDGRDPKDWPLWMYN